MDYAYTSGKVQQYLQPNGTKNRVTILTDEFRTSDPPTKYAEWRLLEMMVFGMTPLISLGS